jgi:hypothetical protein
MSTADVPAPIAAEPPTVPIPAAAPAAPAAGLFESIDWKNPVPAVSKLATHLHSLDMLTSAERLTMLQGSLLYVINTSSMPDLEKDAARIFVSTMVPHIVETAVSGIEAAAKVVAAEKKASDLLASVMSKQPTMVVNNVEEILAAATKRKWLCW